MYKEENIMFNTGNGISLSDIAAVTNGNDSFAGGNGWWVLIILLALWGGFGGYGFGGFGGGSQGAATNYVLSSDFATIQRQLSDGFGATESKLDSISNGICSLGYDQLNQMNGINTNIANLGFQVQQGISDIRYNQATNTCAVTNAINNAAQQIMQNDNANYRQLHDENIALQMEAKNNKIAELTAMLNQANLAASQQAQNNYLIGELKQCPKPAYIVANPYASVNTCCGGCCAA